MDQACVVTSSLLGEILNFVNSSFFLLSIDFYNLSLRWVCIDISIRKKKHLLTMLCMYKLHCNKEYTNKIIPNNYRKGYTTTETKHLRQ